MALFSQIKNFIKSSKGSNLSRRSTIQKFETAQRIVDKENMAKQQAPAFPGLENYEIERRLGE
jgi:hypothetical protein